MTDATADTRLFADHRALLFTVAYEMLGSVADAEDVVQETYLRWSRRPDGPIEHPRAYMVRIATRLALNRLRTLARQKEDYIGPWLPEPMLTSPDIAEDVVLAESVSLAMLIVLESLTPQERAVFVLREVFGFDYDEIAGAVDKTVANVRQIAHRAKEHVQARRPRFEPDPQTVQAVGMQLWQAMVNGDVQALMDVMAPDVVVLTDSNGKRAAARRPVRGADDAARFMVGIMRKADPDIVVDLIEVNGSPAWRATVHGEVQSVGQLVITDGLVSQILVQVNPDKLKSLLEAKPLSLGAQSES